MCLTVQICKKKCNLFENQLINCKKNYIIDYMSFLAVIFKLNEGGTTLLEIKTTEADTSAKIIVIGVGGAGNNAVNRMIDESIGGSQSLSE